MSNVHRGHSIDASYQVSVVAMFIGDIPQMLPTKFQFIWPSGFGGEDLNKSANQKQELSVAAMFVNKSGRNELSL